VTRTIDNWASSGIAWFFGLFLDVDRLMPTRFEVVRDLANRLGRWPVLIHAYHPGVDELGHRYGPQSPQYREAVRNIDRQVTRIREAIESAQMTDRTYLVLLSDHGFETVDNHFDVPDWLQREHGLRVTDRPFENEWVEQRHRRVSRFDAVVINGGNRRAAIHLPGSAGWFERPSPESVQRLLRPDPTTGRPGLVAHPGVELVAIPVEPDGHERVIELLSRHGRSQVQRRRQDGRLVYRYERLENDALGDWTGATLERVIREGWHDSDTWLRATVDSPYPDLVVQMVEMFDSPRAGDIVLFAEDGWDFGSRNRGGHGSITRSDMIVPMVFLGPGIPAGRTIPYARLVDVAPTVLRLLRGHALDPDEPVFDGVDRAPQLLQP
jgi:arylsulfatase A-like enzyme